MVAYAPAVNSFVGTVVVKLETWEMSSTTCHKFGKQRFVGYQAFKLDFKVTRKMNDLLNISKLIPRLQQYENVIVPF